MILRRLTDAFRKQEWFTVAVETMIVVLGVFLGLQVNNWNAANQSREREVVILEQLATEFAVTVEAAKSSKTDSEFLLDATRAVLRAIRDAKEPEDSDTFLRTLGAAGGLDTGPSEPVTLIELMSTGGLTQLSSPGLRTALIRNHETAEAQSKLADLVLARVSTPDDGFHDAIYVNPDYGDGSEFLLGGYDWEKLASARQQFQVIFYGKVGLDRGIEELIERGEAVLTEIEKARECSCAASPSNGSGQE
tara:strand:+ start:244 stop:990 length:747 start_codon:yes stop_codon:yes gene_type:complete